jgi:hypothetical protein
MSTSKKANGRANGSATANGTASSSGVVQDELLQLNLDMKNLKYDEKYASYHGDKLIGVSGDPLAPPSFVSLFNTLSALQDKVAPSGFFANLNNSLDDFKRIFTIKNAPAIGKVLGKMLAGGGLDVSAAIRSPCPKIAMLTGVFSRSKQELRWSDRSLMIATDAKLCLTARSSQSTTACCTRLSLI